MPTLEELYNAGGYAAARGDNTTAQPIEGAVPPAPKIYGDKPLNEYNPPEPKQQKASPLVDPNRLVSAIQLKRAEWKENGVNPHTLYTDPRWVTASKAMWAGEHSPATSIPGEQFIRGLLDGREVPQTDQQWADYGWQWISGFKNNLTVTTLEAAQLANADPAQKAAFLYLLEKSDHFNYTWKGAGRAAYYMVTDPTTYAGLASLGIGLAAATGGKIVTKEALKQALRASVSRGVTLVAAEGAMFSAAGNYMEQRAKVNAGGQSGVSLKEVGIAAAIGGVAGAALGTVPVLANVAARRWFPIGKVDVVPPSIAKATDDLPTTPRRSSTADDIGAPGRLPDNIADNPADPRNLTIRPGAKTAAGLGAPRSPVDAPNVSPATLLPEPTQNALSGLVEAAKRALRGVDAGGMKMSPAQVVEIARPIAKFISDLPPESRQQIAANLANLDAAPPAIRSIAQGFRQVVERLQGESYGLSQQLQKLKNAGLEADVKALEKEMAGLFDALRAPHKTLLDITSEQGRALQGNVGTLNVGSARKLTPEIIAEKFGWDVNNLTDTQKAEILSYQANALKVVEKNAETAKAVRALQKHGDDLIHRGEDAAGYHKMEEARVLRESIETDELNILGITKGGVPVDDPTMMDKAAEYATATVFTPRSLIRNALWPALLTITKPVQEMLAMGIRPESMAHTFGYFAGMKVAAEGAWKAAKITGDTGNALLRTATKDNNAGKFLAYEGGAIGGSVNSPVWMKDLGHKIRFFVRMTKASDEFFRRLHYEGSMAGNAAFNTYVDGLEKGLSLNQIKKNVRNAVKTVHEAAYESRIADTPKLIEGLRATGLRKGMSGDVLDNWVIQHLQENKGLYKYAKNEAYYDAASAMMFDQAFSKSNWASKIAAKYEENIHRVPIMRLFGQLFFRTPVRVFETGLRMTPGVNAVLPNFLADVRGVNGQLRQLRAISEQLTGFAILMSAMSMYAAGALQGSGPTNFDRNDQLRMSGMFVPNSIKLWNGNRISLFGLDPMSTPFKVIGTTLDRLAEQQRLDAEGADRTAGYMQDARDTLSAVAWAIILAVKDANLAQGAKELSDIGVMLTSERANKEGAFGKYLGKKLAMALPTLVKDANKLLMPEAVDTTSASFLGGISSAMQSSVGIQTAGTATKRDPLGNIMKRNPEGAAANAARLLGFAYYSPEGMAMGRSKKDMQALYFLAELAQRANTNFLPPTKAPKAIAGVVAGRDLRDIVLPGRTNVYNAWMDEYRKLDPGGKLQTTIRMLRNMPNIGPDESKNVVLQVLGSLREQAWVNTQRKYQRYLGGPATTATDQVNRALNPVRTPVPFMPPQ